MSERLVDAYEDNSAAPAIEPSVEEGPVSVDDLLRDPDLSQLRYELEAQKQHGAWFRIPITLHNNTHANIRPHSPKHGCDDKDPAWCWRESHFRYCVTHKRRIAESQKCKDRSKGNCGIKRYSLNLLQDTKGLDQTARKRLWAIAHTQLVKRLEQGPVNVSHRGCQNQGKDLKQCWELGHILWCITHSEGMPRGRSMRLCDKGTVQSRCVIVAFELGGQ